MAKVVPKQHGSSHFPGMEGATREGEYWLGMLSVGYSVCNATIGACTNPTVAQMAASPNTRYSVEGNTHLCCGAVVHSLGQEPAFVLIQPRLGSWEGNIVFHTADASAVYAVAQAQNTCGGCGVRVIAVAP